MVIGCELGDVSRVVESPMKGEAPEKWELYVAIMYHNLRCAYRKCLHSFTHLPACLPLLIVGWVASAQVL